MQAQTKLWFDILHVRQMLSFHKSGLEVAMWTRFSADNKNMAVYWGQ